MGYFRQFSVKRQFLCKNHCQIDLGQIYTDFQIHFFNLLSTELQQAVMREHSEKRVLKQCP